MKSYNPGYLEKIIEKFPRVKLVNLPTPVHRLENLAKELGLGELLVKREDLTGLAFGGNKSRKLEFIIADALSKKADTIITWGSLQSNWCLQTAAAARRYGLRPILVLFRTYELSQVDQGNILLEKLLDADIRFFETRTKGKSLAQEEAFRCLEEIADAEKARGHRPYMVSVGGSATGGHMEKPLGALAYFLSMIEVYRQLSESGMPDWIVVASGSGATQAGLLVGARALGLKTAIAGVCVSDSREEFLPLVKKIALELRDMLSLDLILEDEDFILYDNYLGEGYGIINSEITEIIKMVMQKEGLVLDPVYTSKAVIGLVDLARKKQFSSGEKILFLHTGGTPALFAFSDRLLAASRF